ncbi:MAG: hypothetical protein PUA61_08190 [Succinatimonas hippei]|nr:hypothetical protein [Succinatimonas hippei]
MADEDYDRRQAKAEHLRAVYRERVNTYWCLREQQRAVRRRILARAPGDPCRAGLVELDAALSDEISHYEQKYGRRHF